MGFFGKKKAKVEENNESVLKEELETEVENHQNEFRTKQDEIQRLQKKLKQSKKNTIQQLVI